MRKPNGWCSLQRGLYTVLGSTWLKHQIPLDTIVIPFLIVASYCYFEDTMVIQSIRGKSIVMISTPIHHFKRNQNETTSHAS